MPPLSVGTIWTFQEREWLDAFWAYRWLFIYCRSGVRDNLLPHRRPTTWAELRIPGLTQLLTVNSRANVCFHEVTPFACRIRPLFAESLESRRPGKMTRPFSGVMGLAVALSWATDLFLNGRPIPR
jgi:hypothetical protein